MKKRIVEKNLNEHIQQENTAYREIIRKNMERPMRYQVWYMKPEFFRDGIMGKLPQASNLSATHVYLKDIEARGLNEVYHQMQAEFWSPNGDARALIQMKGLEHTSMSVGDVVIDDVGNGHVVANTGFNAIGGFKS